MRESLQLPDTTVRRWLRELVDLEYLKPERPRPGEKSTTYTVDGLGLGERASGLLTPDELAAKVNPPTRQKQPKRHGGVHLTGVPRHAR
jgi:hypothetical protein